MNLFFLRPEILVFTFVRLPTARSQGYLNAFLGDPHPLSPTFPPLSFHLSPISCVFLPRPGFIFFDGHQGSFSPFSPIALRSTLLVRKPLPSFCLLFPRMRILTSLHPLFFPTFRTSFVSSSVFVRLAARFPLYVSPLDFYPTLPVLSSHVDDFISFCFGLRLFSLPP